MKASLQCIVLLACVVTCFSLTTIKRCKCINVSQKCDPKLIKTVETFSPRPYCKNQEVIVKLKDDSSVCLDPKSKFTQAVLNVHQRQILAAQAAQAAQAKKNETSVTESTTRTSMGSTTIVV